MTRKPDRRRGAPAHRRARDHATSDTSSVLRRDAILVAPSPVGYLCVGLGAAARTLRFALEAPDDPASRDPFADPFSLAATMALRDVTPTPVVTSSTALAKHADPTLDRLAAIAGLAKFGGYNPDEPRDEDGRWTTGPWHEIGALFTEGAAAVGDGLSEAESAIRNAGARTASLLGEKASEFSSETQSAMRGVVNTAERIAADAGEVAADAAPKISTAVRILPKVPPGMANAATAVIALVVTPFNNYQRGSGKLPFRPGLQWDIDDQILTIRQLAENGDVIKVYEGHPDFDRVYRSSDGVVIGRWVGAAGFDPDIEGVFTMSGRADLEYDSKTRADWLKPDFIAKAQSTVAANEDRQKACPPMTPESIAGRSDQTIAYQEFITNIPPGFDFKILGVSFDNCRELSRVTEEAKAFTYEWLMQQDWFTGVGKIMSQAARQSYADELWEMTRGDWYFAEKGPAAYFKARFAIFPNLRVQWKEFEVDSP